MEYLGNQDLLNVPKTAFLASSQVSTETVLKVFDWATEMRKQGACVVSGFSSQLERDVLHFLLKGTQPVIMVLARRMYHTIPAELQEPLAQGRLLIIAVGNSLRQSKGTAMVRNRYVCDLAERVWLVGVTPMSSLYPLQADFRSKLI